MGVKMLSQQREMVVMMTILMHFHFAEQDLFQTCLIVIKDQSFATFPRAQKSIPYFSISLLSTISNWCKKG